MKFNSKDSFKSLDKINSSGKDYKFFNLNKAEKNGLDGISRLPKSLKVLLLIDIFLIFVSVHMLMYKYEYLGMIHQFDFDRMTYFEARQARNAVADGGKHGRVEEVPAREPGEARLPSSRRVRASTLGPRLVRAVCENLKRGELLLSRPTSCQFAKNSSVVLELFSWSSIFK